MTFRNLVLQITVDAGNKTASGLQIIEGIHDPLFRINPVGISGDFDNEFNDLLHSTQTMVDVLAELSALVLGNKDDDLIDNLIDNVLGGIELLDTGHHEVTSLVELLNGLACKQTDCVDIHRMTSLLFQGSHRDLGFDIGNIGGIGCHCIHCGGIGDGFRVKNAGRGGVLRYQIQNDSSWKRLDNGFLLSLEELLQFLFQI